MSRFFGLTPDNKADVILEPAFLLMYHCGFTFVEAYNLPVQYKRWFIERLNKELTAHAADGETATRAAHQNTPDIRAMQGRTRTNVPSKLRRFT